MLKVNVWQMEMFQWKKAEISRLSPAEVIACLCGLHRLGCNFEIKLSLTNKLMRDLCSLIWEIWMRILSRIDSNIVNMTEYLLWKCINMKCLLKKSKLLSYFEVEFSLKRTGKRIWSYKNFRPHPKIAVIDMQC